MGGLIQRKLKPGKVLISKRGSLNCNRKSNSHSNNMQATQSPFPMIIKENAYPGIGPKTTHTPIYLIERPLNDELFLCPVKTPGLRLLNTGAFLLEINLKQLNSLRLYDTYPDIYTSPRPVYYTPSGPKISFHENTIPSFSNSRIHTTHSCE